MKIAGLCVFFWIAIAKIVRASSIFPGERDNPTPYIMMEFPLYGDDVICSNLGMKLNFDSGYSAGSQLLGKFWHLGTLHSVLFSDSENTCTWIVSPRKKTTLRRSLGREKFYENSGWLMETQSKRISKITSKNGFPIFTFASGRVSKFDFGTDIGSFKVIYGPNNLPTGIFGQKNESLSINYYNLENNDFRIKSISGKNGSIIFEYGKFEIYEALNPFPAPVLLIKKIVFPNGDEMQISYKAEVMHRTFRKSVYDHLPASWVFAGDGSGRTNIMKIEAVYSGRKFEKICKWDAESGSLSGLNDKIYVCAFPSLDKKNNSMLFDELEGSFQVTELNNEFSEAHPQMGI